MEAFAPTSQECIGCLVLVSGRPFAQLIAALWTDRISPFELSGVLSIGRVSGEQNSARVEF